MIKLEATHKEYIVYFEEKQYKLLISSYEDEPDNEYIEVLYDNKPVEQETWNRIIQYWDMIEN